MTSVRLRAFLLPSVALFCFSCDSAWAEVRLPKLLSDHMVLQRDMPIRIWGWADAHEEVSVVLNGQRAECTAGSDGKWQVVLPAMKAGGPYDLMVKGTNELKVVDVLIGELWFCSGQSNMAWLMVGKTTRMDEDIPRADHPRIRLLMVPQPPEGQPIVNEPKNDLAAEWRVCSPKTVGWFSAVAYYFARELERELQVPVGVMVSAVNGTRIEPWTPAVGVEAISELKGKDEPRDGELFNTMIRPFVPMTIRGVIWYQGEGNVGDGFLYYHRMRALIAGWRSEWGLGDFPFYFVQIAPLNWGGKPKDQQADIWEAQTAAMRIPHTGMVVTNDIGNIGDAHPRNKRDVGIRLANWALAKTYGRQALAFSGPIYRSMDIEGNKIRIHFDYAAGGLAARDGKPLTWFTIAGSDGVFRPAVGEIDGETVVVSSQEVPQPTHVRFGWHQIAEPNLMNAAGLPASSFRTDGPE